MPKPTPVQLAAELTELDAEYARAKLRYNAPGTGLGQRARAARHMAELYGRREALSVLAVQAFRSGATRELVGHLSSVAAANDAHQAKAWAVRAEQLEREAAALERITAAAFNDDGMEWVPGRGRVRRSL